jgi:hypothetical protein
MFQIKRKKKVWNTLTGGGTGGTGRYSLRSISNAPLTFPRPMMTLEGRTLANRLGSRPKIHFRHDSGLWDVESRPTISETIDRSSQNTHVALFEILAKLITHPEEQYVATASQPSS